MLQIFDKINSSKEKGHKPAVVFLDIKKAFDTVNHELFLEKLNYYRINGAVYNWFKSYLSNRYQSTKFGKRISVALLILCGVPQGSILNTGAEDIMKDGLQNKKLGLRIHGKKIITPTKNTLKMM